MITLAFYKGRAASRWHRLQDAVIRWATRGQYSHVELIAGPAQLGNVAECLSASGRDGGVRAKRIYLRPEAWHLVEMPEVSDELATYILARIGARYDYLGILLCQVLALGRHDPGRWFCSEIIAEALGIPQPQRISPQGLFDLLAWHQPKTEAPKGKALQDGA